MGGWPGRRSRARCVRSRTSWRWGRWPPRRPPATCCAPPTRCAPTTRPCPQRSSQSACACPSPCGCRWNEKSLVLLHRLSKIVHLFILIKIQHFIKFFNVYSIIQHFMVSLQNCSLFSIVSSKCTCKWYIIIIIAVYSLLDKSIQVFADRSICLVEQYLQT